VRRRARGERGQVVVAALLVALVVATAVAVVGIALARAAVDRAHAQRAADAAALAGALVLARQPGEAAPALAAARRVAAASGVEVLDARLLADVVEIRVARPARRVQLPRLLGGTSVRVRPQAVARAAPGAPVPLDVGGDVGGAVLPASLAHPSTEIAGAGTGDVPAWVPDGLRAAFAAAGAREGVPVGLLAAQARVESGFDPDAVSPAGAQGLAQFMPGTWAGAWNPWRLRSPFDPLAAVAAQARYLRRLLVDAGGDVARALGGYNAGAGRVRGPFATWPAETRAYVARVLALARGTAGRDPETLAVGPRAGVAGPAWGAAPTARLVG
jgi:soluble lytic murein transglycosylase-like protein